MLKFLRKRKNQKRIFIALAVVVIPAFIYWGSSGVTRTQKKGQKDYAGVIFGRRVGFQEYMDNLEAAKNKLILQFGSRLPNLEKYIDLNALTWERIILLAEARKQKIKISDQELVAFIRSIIYFQKNGEFDQNIYESALRYTFRTTAREFEEDMRQDLMVNSLLQKEMANVTVSEAEVMESYKKENKKFNAKRFEAEKTKWQEIVLQKKRLEAIDKFLTGLKTKAGLKDYLPKDTSPTPSS